MCIIPLDSLFVLQATKLSGLRAALPHVIAPKAHLSPGFRGPVTHEMLFVVALDQFRHW